jgi:NADPH2:quinone reductase
VIATCSDADRDVVTAAGADVVLNYRAGDLAAQVLTANDGKQVETIVEVEFGLNIGTDAALIAPNGRIAPYGSTKEMEPALSFGPLLFKAVTIDIILIYLLPAAERDAAISRLHHALDDGALTCPTERIYPLAETAAAHEAVEKGRRNGAILIDCQG